LREGDGETLDEIAREVDLPAPRVRQRVSRLRRHFHARWLALGAAGLLSLLGIGALFYKALEPAFVPPSIAQEPTTPLDRARVLRQHALQRCTVGAYPECIAALDQAKALDPSGESASAIREAREAAANAVQPKQIRNLPAGTPPASAPDTNSTPKQHAPSKLKPKQPAPSKSQSSSEPKQLAPSKPLKKGEPLGANLQQNAPPSQQALPSYDDLTGSQPASKAGSKPETKQPETKAFKGSKK
jgi:hypothetical protein